MKKAKLKQFFEALGFNRIRTRRSWVDASCPFARWEHKNGQDKHQSFGAKASDKGSSFYKCFGCKATGKSMEMLLVQLNDYVDIPEDAWQYVNEHEPDHVAPDEIVESLKRDSDESTAPVWNEDELDPYRGSVPQYFLDRGFSIETAKHFDLGYDENNERLVIPIRNRQGDLVGMQGRELHDQGRRYHNYWNFPKSEVLFGVHSVPNGELEALHIVEGPFDVLRLYEYGYNAVSIMGSSPSRQQVNMVTFYDATIYLMPDGDEQGDDVITQFQYYAPDEALLLDAQCPEGTDPDELSQDDVQTLRDEARPVQLPT